MIYNTPDQTPQPEKKRKLYKHYTDIQTEARAVVCMVCAFSFCVSAYVGKPIDKPEKCPYCGCRAAFDQFFILIAPPNVLEHAQKYIVIPDDEISRLAKEVNSVIG